VNHPEAEGCPEREGLAAEAAEAREQPGIGFGRIVASEIEVPNMLVDLV
jgi:hypothetical protein